MNQLDTYFLFECLPLETKKANGIRSESRLDCTKYYGNYRGLEPFLNKKGMMYLFPADTDEFIECNGKRMSTKALTNGTLNLSSLYTENANFIECAYGYPNARKTLKNGKTNPLYEFRHEGYLFIKNAELSKIELFVIIGGRNLIKEAFNRFIDNDFEIEINQMRNEAKEFFKYKSIEP
jgi:hypothetical protein